MKFSRSDLLVCLSIAIFLIWKFSTLHFRFGDENVYFYMTKAIANGLVPYKDFNLADPPVFIYLLTGFKTLIGSHFILFKIWPPLLDSASAILIFLILKKLGNRFAALGPALYLFSFTVLSTSDYVTGAETAIFFMLLALYVDTRSHSADSRGPIYVGIWWALACLSKLYIAPALLAFLAYKLYQKEFKTVRNIVMAGIVTGTLILVPFFLYAPHETLSNLIVYQLHRPAGINKWFVLGTFFEMEWLLVLTGIAGAFVTKHRAFIGPVVVSFVFFLWFRDLYYLYLHLLMPFLVLLAAELVASLALSRAEFAWGFIGFYAIVLMYPLLMYVNTYAPQDIFEHPEEIAQALRQAPENRPVYGAQEVAPLVALMAGTSIFQNAIDTNTQNFQTGALDIQKISNAATHTGIYLIARIADYPAQGIMDTGYESYFAKEDFQSCTRYQTFPRVSPADPLNDVVIYRCSSGSF